MKQLLTRLAGGLALLFLLPLSVFAQEGSISGTVTDAETGEPLPGANVVIQDLNIGAATDADGDYAIDNVPAGEHTLRASFVGYEALEVEVSVAAGEEVTRDIALEPDYAGLEEVVVVGYGERQRRDITGSVTSISVEDIEDVPVSSPEQLLQGTSGVQVTTTSGMAGAAISVRVRGPSSIEGSSEPLYVVDGVPIISGDFGSDVGTAATNALADLNPNDIESIEVLKDASATAIYGSRGANGVVMITTKQGRAQQTEINFGYQLGSVQATDEWDVLSGPEWAEIYQEAFDNFDEIEFGGQLGDIFGRPELAFGYPQVPDPSEAPNTNWVDEVFETGTRQQFDLSARGGNESTRFYVSGTLDDNDNYVRSNEFRRISGRANLEHDPFEWAQIGARIGVTRTLNERAAADNLVAAPLTSSALTPPILDIRTEDGAWNWSNPWNIADNVVASSVLNNYDAFNWRTQGNSYIEVRPISDLTLRTQGGMDILTMDEYFRYVQESTDGAPNGFGAQYYREQRNYTINTTADYRTSAQDGLHRFGGLVGFEYEQQERKNVFASATGFPSNDFANIASAADPSTTSATVDRKARLESYFTRLDYTFDDRYIFDVSARIDGSSRFGEENRYGFFPAGSVAWRLSEEAFMQGYEFLDELKLRASYGVTGNDQIGFFDALALYGSGDDYAQEPGTSPSSLASPELQWESVAQLDVGLDVGLFNERIFFTADYYNKRTSDLILPVQVPLSSGFSSVPQNVGEMVNRGVDLSLETQNFAGAFRWSTNVQVSYLENEVLSLVDDEPIISGVQSARVGEPLGVFFLIPWEGVDPETGRPQWRDQDGELTHSPTSSDRRVTGKVLPTWAGSIGNRFGFGGLELSVLLQFEEGRDFYNDTYRFLMLPATFNLHRDYLDRWQEPGDQTDVPRNVFADIDNATQQSTRWLEDGSYLRVKDVTLSYTLPESMLGALQLSHARIFVRGTNLLTFDRVSVGDPEASFAGQEGTLNGGEAFFTAPQQRTITGGVRFSL